MSRLVLFAWLVVLFNLAAKVALADAREATLTRAVAAKEIALDQPEPARWQEAFDRFMEADAIESSADTKYELGFIASQLRQEDLAVDYYAMAIALGLSGPGRDKAQAFIAEFGPMMARLEIHGRSGTRLRIRGIDRGKLPLSMPVVVFAGETQLEVIRPGELKVQRQLLHLLAGTTKRLNLETESQPVHLSAFREPTVFLQPARRFDALGGPSTFTRNSATWLAGAGFGLTFASGLLLPVSYLKLASKREQLTQACDPASSIDDGCQYAKPGRYEEALACADDVARWKTARAIGWAGLGVGAISTTVGLALMWRRADSGGLRSQMVLGRSMDTRSLVLSWRGLF